MPTGPFVILGPDPTSLSVGRSWPPSQGYQQHSQEYISSRYSMIKTRAGGGGKILQVDIVPNSSGNFENQIPWEPNSQRIKFLFPVWLSIFYGLYSTAVSTMLRSQPISLAHRDWLLRHEPLGHRAEVPVSISGCDCMVGCLLIYFPCFSIEPFLP
jgi:hypothetical protein